MKLKTIVVFIGVAAALVFYEGSSSRAADEAALSSLAQSNAVVISSDFIARLVDEAQTKNPGILAADSRVKAGNANVASVRAWEDPMFTIGGTLFSPQGFDAAQEGDVSYGISEKLPLWGKPALNRRAAAAAASTRNAERDLRYKQLQRDITKQLIAAALAERGVELGEQDLAWLAAAAKTVETKYRAGRMDAADALEIQNQVAVRTDQLRTDRLEAAHDGFALDRLLNRTADSTWPVFQLPAVAPPVPFSAKLMALVLTNEPRLKVMGQEIQQAKVAVQLAHRSRLPDVSVGIEGNQYSGDGGFRSGMFTLSFPLPWENAAKYRSDYERERQNQKALEQEREEQELTTREALNHLTIDLDAARRQALLYTDEISVRAMQALTDRMAEWEAGRITLREVLDSRREALDAEWMAARATASQHQMLAELMLWTGLEDFGSLHLLANEPSLVHHHDTADK